MKAKKDSNLIEKKQNDKYRAIGRAIVATEQRHDTSVRDVLMACKGYTPPQLELVKEGVLTAYKATLDAYYEKASTEGFTGGMALPDNFSGMRQAIWNRKSEKMAILDAFRLYSGMDKKEAKLFDDACEDATSIHALVTLCRATVNISKGGTGKAPAVRSKTVSAKGFSVTLERVSRMDKEQLEKLYAAVQAAMRKFAAPPVATVTDIAKARRRKLASVRADLVTKKTRKTRKVA